MGQGPNKSHSEVGPHLFRIGRVVGRGSFGKVYVVILKHNKKMFAMKQLAKKDILEKNMVDSVNNEKNILADVIFPFLTNLYFCYQTETHLHMVMDLMMGGDVGFHLDKCGSFSEERSLFYTACILLSLEYLHLSKKIVHRDLKPGNFLLDSEGYCHLSDFNVSLWYDEKKPPSTCSGTKRYMAPEVLQRKPYDFAVDIWSMGVCTYEFLTGKTPWSKKEFKDDAERVAALQSEPPDVGRFPKDTADFLEKCLQPDPKKRPTIPELKQHPYFKTINWDQFLEKQITAPFVPEKNRAYVNVNHDLEDQLVPEKKRKVTAEENLKFKDWDFIRDVTVFFPAGAKVPLGSAQTNDVNRSREPDGSSGEDDGDKEKEKEKPGDSGK